MALSDFFSGSSLVSALEAGVAGSALRLDESLSPLDRVLGPPIDALNQLVFSKVVLFGVPVEALVLMLAFAMVFFTFWLGLPQWRFFGHSFALLRGKYADPSAPGQGSHFAALSTALSGTVGLGNIAGVAIAISLGGPGAAFWMFVIGLFAMALKCAEVTLGLKYRRHFADGSVAGGPMYYLRDGFKRFPALAPIGLVLGGFYAFAALGGAIPMLQTNQSYVQVASVTGLDHWLGDGQARLAYGVFMAFGVALVVLGSAKRLAAVTSALVPAMCAIYLFGGLAVLIANASAIPEAFSTIFAAAFNTHALTGGLVGAFIIGMKRAVYSCEAGIGSAVMAHSLARTREPASEGMVALLEPFIDTVVICTMSALVVIVTNSYQIPGAEGVQITSAAFQSVISWFPYVLAVAVFLFAYSTLVSWGYYGIQAWGFLFGRSKLSIWTYRILYCALIPLGSILPLGKVVDFIDACFFLMAVPNIIGLFFMAGEIRREIQSYWRRLKAGEIRPTSTPKSLMAA